MNLRHKNKLKPGSLDDSLLFCKEIMKGKSSFFMALHFTPKDKRNAIFAIYTWLRAIDDIADDPKSSEKTRLKRLQKFHETTLAVLSDKKHKLLKESHSFWPAFRYVVKHYHIATDDLEGMVKGQYQDLKKKDYKTFAELYVYCSLVASTVGSICIDIWGYDGTKHAKQMAIWCGIAFQLTNILRDLKEDLYYKRVYLPADYVGLKSLTAANFDQVPKHVLLRGINKLIKKAEGYFKKSLKLYKSLDNDGKLSFLLMFYTYYALLNKIKHNPEAVLKGDKIKLSWLEKSKLILTAIYNHGIFKKGKLK